MSVAPAARHGILPDIYKLKEKDKATFYSPREEWIMPAASTIKPEEREFVVDSGASMDMVSKRDSNSAELETREDIEESDDSGDGQRQGANNWLLLYVLPFNA